MSFNPTIFKQNTQIFKDFSVLQNTLSSYDIINTSGVINLTTDNTFLNTYDNYSLDGSQLPIFTLGRPIQELNIIQKKKLSLLNKLNGNVKIKLNESGSYGVMNLTFNNPKINLMFINNQWNVLSGPPLYVDTQQGSKLVGTNASGSGALQGISVSLSADGNTLAIGGIRDKNFRGATWIFTRSVTTWTQQGSKLIGTGYSGNSNQGYSVSLSADGNTLAIGAPDDDNFKGATWIFTRSGTTWTQQGAKLIGSSDSGNARQGQSVSLSADGNTLAIGGIYDTFNTGATWIFIRSGTIWTQQGNKLVGSGYVGDSNQGSSVSLSANGNTLAIGGYRDNNFNGATWIFTRSGTTWTQQGSKLVGTGATGTGQGGSVSLSDDGNTLAIGGYEDYFLKGVTWIFTRFETTWTQQGEKLIGTGSSGSSSAQAISVSLSADGNTLAIGGPTNNVYQGAIWIFTRENTIWTQQGEKFIGTGNIGAAQQGYSVSLSANGNTLAIGGLSDNSNRGATWIFT